MKTFQDRINSIAQRKVLSRALSGKTPNYTYYGLEADEQQALIAALINEDEEVRQLLASKISNAIEDSYCDQIRFSEAEDDAIDLRRFAEEDAASRARDLWLEQADYRTHIHNSKASEVW